MGEWGAVASEYRLMNRCIPDAMNLWARWINFTCVREHRERMLLSSALPQGQGSIDQINYHMFESWWKLLSMAADVEWTIHQNERQQSVNRAPLEHQQSIRDLWLCILGILCSDWLQTSIYQIWAAFTGKYNRNMLPAASWKWASMEHQQF
jgi:hypothetical protein